MNELSKSKKRIIITDTLIYGFGEFLKIAQEFDVKDDSVSQIYFYIQGLRDSIRDNQTLVKEWKRNDELKRQFVDMLYTLGQYQRESYWAEIKRLITELLNRWNKFNPKGKIAVQFEHGILSKLLNAAVRMIREKQPEKGGDTHV